MTSPSTSSAPSSAARPDWPDGAAASFTHRFRVLWRDVDALGHVNNATYLSYVEEARLAYQRRLLGTRDRDAMPWVVAEARCRYLWPIRLDEEVEVRLRVTRLGTSSVTFAFRISTHDGPVSRVAAEGQVVQVHVDLATGRSKPLPTAWREQIERYEAAASDASDR